MSANITARFIAMKGRISFLLVAAAVLAFACGPRPRASEAPVTAHVSRARSHDPIELASSLDVNFADGVTFDFRVVNPGDRKVEVNFPSGKTHELVVLDSLGREVWRWSSGRMFTQALQNKVMHSSDTLSWAGRWRNAPAGKYVAIATLASENYPVESRTEFTVTNQR
jgi:hypothetical protein